MSEERMNQQELLTWRTRFVNGSFYFVLAALGCLVLAKILGLYEYRKLYYMNRFLMGSGLSCALLSGSLGIFINRNLANFARSYAVGCGCGVLAALQAIVLYSTLSKTSPGAFGLVAPLLCYVCTTIVVLFLFHKISHELKKLGHG